MALFALVPVPKVPDIAHAVRAIVVGVEIAGATNSGYPEVTGNAVASSAIPGLISWTGLAGVVDEVLIGDCACTF